MKTLSKDLKRILTGLAHQDAGEFLPLSEKMKVLGREQRSRGKPSMPPRNIEKKSTSRRIAFISDGRGIGAPLAYAIDACSRQDAKLDLLIHGTTDTENISALERQIRAAGLGCHRIQFGMDCVDDIIDYICNHPSLIFLVAMPDDHAVKILIEEAIAKRGGRVPVPLALIEDRPSSRQAEQSAA